MIARFVAVLLPVAALAGCSGTSGQPAVRRAVEYLWSQQSEDGGWHSKKYGLLRSGQSLTPFVLATLLEAEPTAGREKIDQAVAFIRKNTSSEGALGVMDPAVPDYPNYATALAVLVFVKMKQDPAAMADHLKRQQFSEANGWNREHPAYGGWGMGGEIRRPPDAGHVDLSMTRFVLQALAAAGVSRSDPVFERASVFLDRCQNPDGGFYFSPVELVLNKAGEESGRPRSYGTATADGILALRAIGRPAEKAEAWLRSNHIPDQAPGFNEPARIGWSRALRFYYAAAAKQAIPSLHISLLPQASDGSYANPENMQKEDDPLIATTLAVRAMLK